MSYQTKVALGFVKLVAIIYFVLFWRAILHLITFEALRREETLSPFWML